MRRLAEFGRLMVGPWWLPLVSFVPVGLAGLLRESEPWWWRVAGATVAAMGILGAWAKFVATRRISVEKVALADQTAKRIAAIIVVGAIAIMVAGLTIGGTLPLLILMLLIAAATFVVVRADRSRD